MTFKQVEPLRVGPEPELSAAVVGRAIEIADQYGDGVALYYPEARALRDWLNSALGEDSYVRVPREDLEMWWFQCEQGLFTEHGECPATYACSSILSDLRDLDPSLAAAPSTSAQEEEEK